jgi:hypothetical protein
LRDEVCRQSGRHEHRREGQGSFRHTVGRRRQAFGRGPAARHPERLDRGSDRQIRASDPRDRRHVIPKQRFAHGALGSGGTLGGEVAPRLIRGVPRQYLDGIIELLACACLHDRGEWISILIEERLHGAERGKHAALRRLHLCLL